MKDMEGKVALVTGGAQGIGLATAREFGRRGAHAVICDLVDEHAEVGAKALRDEGFAASAYVLDVADRSRCQEVAQRIRREVGQVSMLVNNAGIAGMASMGDAHSARLWDAAMAINLTGSYNVAVACLDDLKATHGSICNISSVVAFTSGLAQVGYTASKGGVRSLTQAMARELSPFGIRVNAVAPGYVETPMTAPNKERFLQWLEIHCPMKRYGLPDELAKPIVFLCSQDASFINGVTLPVDGGYLVV